MMILPGSWNQPLHSEDGGNSVSRTVHWSNDLQRRDDRANRGIDMIAQ